VDAVWHSGVNPESPAQADLFATFDGCFAGPDPWRAQADEDIWCAPELLKAWACRITRYAARRSLRDHIVYYQDREV